MMKVMTMVILEQGMSVLFSSKPWGLQLFLTAYWCFCCTC